MLIEKLISDLKIIEPENFKKLLLRSLENLDKEKPEEFLQFFNFLVFCYSELSPEELERKIQLTKSDLIGKDIARE